MAVRTILTNPAYTGERHGVKRAHPAIVSRRLFNRAQAALDARRRRVDLGRRDPVIRRSALNIREPLYDAALERMEAFEIDVVLNRSP
jgi:hypothetical protein